jgi:hypothetical protein
MFYTLGRQTSRRRDRKHKIHASNHRIKRKQAFGPCFASAEDTRAQGWKYRVARRFSESQDRPRNLKSKTIDQLRKNREIRICKQISAGARRKQATSKSNQTIAPDIFWIFAKIFNFDA